ncbi:MAG TPA: fumarylacetoacetate hydrolase family protein [Bacteroidota bacterium]|jgi:2-keto-4-pentenoate hydratase/2-oxohepta-3-ene-1,7-dioic acid hydratase in catechol pathway
MRTVTLRSGNAVGVGKILCLGRNYAEHAREMDSELPEFPIVFLKPSTALLADGGGIKIPSFSSELHHEVELVVLIGKECRNIALKDAWDHIAGYAVGLDMTLRDVQTEAKKRGLPWSVAKGFDTSAPISTIVEKSAVPNPSELSLSLSVNGKIRQNSNTNKMIFSIDHVVSYLSSIFTLEQGDLIFTGTPEGVGAVVPGDILEAKLESVGTLRVHVEHAA